MRRMVGLALAASLSASSHALADDGDITVMTYNQYLGADFSELAEAQDAAEFNMTLLGILERIAASNFEERAQRQAAQIARHLPDLVGLQEVWTLACIDLGPPTAGEGCDHPAIAGAFTDHEAVTLDALSDLGADYASAARVMNLDIDIPFVINGFFAMLTVTDHDLILERAETVTYSEPVTFPGCDQSQDGCNYQVSLPVPFLGSTVDFLRGFVAVEATVRGRDYLFANTHLEVKSALVPPIIQSLQAFELIQRLAFLQQVSPFTPLILVGDINSSPEDEPVPTGLEPPFDTAVPPYQQFVAADYHDVWALRPGAVPGFTCCQAEDLTNQRSTLDERIDMIFSSDLPRRVKQVRLVGDRNADKTWPPGRGLWPSDHAGVVATLQFE